MQIIQKLSNLKAARKHWLETKKSVAFVPTMGNLHQGHLNLVKHASSIADVVVVSIFVNPMQFGAHEDLDKYPRTFDSDCRALEELGVAAVFCPTPELMYPKGLSEQTFVQVPKISEQLCGESRPGHFRGVATVVCKLFNMVMPDIAVFGQKDYQQLQVIRQMVDDLSIAVSIHGVPTERAEDGLALSSRNQYLTAQQRQSAALIFATLGELRQQLMTRPEGQQSFLTQAEDRLVAEGFVMDYLSIRQADTLAPFLSDDTDGVILIAAKLGNTRLIDNLQFSVKSAD